MGLLFLWVECTNQPQDVPIKLNKFTKFNDTLKIERRAPEFVNRGNTPRAQCSVATRQGVICGLEIEEAKELVE